jgi:hypothetical protein
VADAAAAAIRRAVEEARDLASRSKVLPARRDHAATNDTGAAPADYLSGIADGMDIPYQRAVVKERLQVPLNELAGSLRRQGREAGRSTLSEADPVLRSLIRCRDP